MKTKGDIFKKEIALLKATLLNQFYIFGFLGTISANWKVIILVIGILVISILEIGH